MSALPRVAVTEVLAAVPTPKAARPPTAREARCRLQSRRGALAAANPARKERAGSAVTQPRRVRPPRRPGARRHRARAHLGAQAEERTGEPQAAAPMRTARRWSAASAAPRLRRARQEEVEAPAAASTLARVRAAVAPAPLAPQRAD